MFDERVGILVGFLVFVIFGYIVLYIMGNFNDKDIKVVVLNVSKFIGNIVE